MQRIKDVLIWLYTAVGILVLAVTLVAAFSWVCGHLDRINLMSGSLWNIPKYLGLFYVPFVATGLEICVVDFTLGESIRVKSIPEKLNVAHHYLLGAGLVALAALSDLIKFIFGSSGILFIGVGGGVLAAALLTSHSNRSFFKKAIALALREEESK